MAAITNQQGRRDTALRRGHAFGNGISACLPIARKAMWPAITGPKILRRPCQISAGNHISGTCLPRVIRGPVKYRRRRWIYAYRQLQPVSRQDISYTFGCRYDGLWRIKRQARQIPCYRSRWRRAASYRGFVNTHPQTQTCIAASVNLFHRSRYAQACPVALPYLWHLGQLHHGSDYAGNEPETCQKNGQPDIAPPSGRASRASRSCRPPDDRHACFQDKCKCHKNNDSQGNGGGGQSFKIRGILEGCILSKRLVRPGRHQKLACRIITHHQNDACDHGNHINKNPPFGDHENRAFSSP